MPGKRTMGVIGPIEPQEFLLTVKRDINCGSLGEWCVGAHDLIANRVSHDPANVVKEMTNHELPRLFGFALKVWPSQSQASLTMIELSDVVQLSSWTLSDKPCSSPCLHLPFLMVGRLCCMDRKLESGNAHFMVVSGCRN